MPPELMCFTQRASLLPVASYKTDYYFWEMVELVRRTILVGWMNLIPTDKTFLRLVVALLVSVASLTLLLSISPYTRAEE